jgi:hypothetical protein
LNESAKKIIASARDWFEQRAFNIHANRKERSLITKIDNSSFTINDIANVASGIKTYEVGKGRPMQTEEVREQKPYTSEKRVGKAWQPFFDGKHIGRYQLFWSNNNWIKYGQWLAAPRDPSLFEGEKILIRKITGRTLISTYVSDTSYCNTLLFVLKLKNRNYSYKCILGILNSALIGWYFRKKFQISEDDTFPQIMIRDILQLPIPKISPSLSKGTEKNVDLLLQLYNELQIDAPADRIRLLQSRIDHIEDRINSLIYDIYGLNEEDIKIIESQ